MTDSTTADADTSPNSDNLYADERYLVRNPRQVQHLLRALVEQRSLITAHPSGRDQSFPTAILDMDADEDYLVLDGSPIPSVNQAAGEASHLLCYAKLDQVTVRFEVHHPTRTLFRDRAAFRAPLPEQIYHLQRRELYRLETPINDSPWCTLPLDDTGKVTPELRVIDISAGGIALSFSPGQLHLGMFQRLRNCTLRLPDTAPLQLDLEVRDQREYVAPNGTPLERVGLKFMDLPRGADASIQRYIFRVDRQRKARLNGDL